MTIRRKIEYPTTEVTVSISFETALDVVCKFAESDLPGGHFAYREVQMLESAARLIRGKLNDDEQRSGN